MQRVKTCSGSGCEKEVYGKRTGPIPKYCPICKLAWRASQMNVYYAKNPQKFRDRSTRRRLEIPRDIIADLLFKAKYRAKNKGLAFNLDRDDIVIPEICPVLGTPLDRKPGGFSNPNVGTLDRIIPEKGYVKGNVQVISWKANRLKNNGTLADFEAICKYLRRVG